MLNSIELKIDSGELPSTDVQTNLRNRILKTEVSRGLSWPGSVTASGWPRGGNRFSDTGEYPLRHGQRISTRVPA